jgi:hypothetical protein
MQNIVKIFDTPGEGQIVFNIFPVHSLNGALYSASVSGGPGGQHFFHLSKRDARWKILHIISGAAWIFNYEEELGKAIDESIKQKQE